MCNTVRAPRVAILFSPPFLLLLLSTAALLPQAHASRRSESVKLFIAAWNGDATAAAAALRLGADPAWRNTDDDDVGQTPVMAAAMRGHSDVLDLMLAQGDAAEACAQDSKGADPLAMASKRGHNACVASLKEWRAKHECVVAAPGTRTLKKAFAAEDIKTKPQRPQEVVPAVKDVPVKEVTADKPSADKKNKDEGGWFSGWFGGGDKEL